MDSAPEREFRAEVKLVAGANHASSVGAVGGVHREFVQANGPLLANGIYIGFAGRSLIVEPSVDLDIGVVESVIARDVVGKNFRP